MNDKNALTPEMARALDLLFHADAERNVTTENAMLVRDEIKRLRARLAEVEAQRDALVPLAGYAVAGTLSSTAEQDDAARATLTAIAAERGKEAP
jgi:enhancing lycopene biosynthesis protein 2